MLCPSCGQEFSQQEKVCPHCGQALPDPINTEPTASAELDTEWQAGPDLEEQDSASSNPSDAALEEDPAASEVDTETSADSDLEADDAPEVQDDAEGEDPGETDETEEENTLPESAAEAVSDSAAETETQAETKKKRSPLAAILIAIIGLLLIIVVCLTIALTTLSQTGTMPGFVSAITDLFHRDNFDADAVAIRLQDQDGKDLAEISNAQLSYYYWGEYYYYVQTSGFGFDASVSLADQQYSDDMTWQDYFLQNACTSIQQIEALKAAATEAGFTMPEEYQTEYDTTIASMADYAVQAGFTDSDGNGDVLAYIQDSYGSAATEDSFAQYLYDSYYVTAYSDEIYNSLSFTDEEIEAYYDDNSDMFEAYGIEKSELPNVNVRHILIEPAATETESEESSAVEDSAVEDANEEAAWADAEAEAERIYEEWKAGDATEESFGELANTYSADTGSNTTGGLYEDVYPGQMVEEFNDWCFDSNRKPGDTAIVETSYGYHIMYYVGATENYYWKTAAESELHYQEYDAKLSEIVNQYTTSTTEDLDITTPDAVDAIASSSTGTTAVG